MYWIMEVIIIFLGYYMIMRSYKSFRIKFEKLEELNDEFILTHLVYMRKKEDYFSLSEVINVNFSKMIIKNNKFSGLGMIIILENNDIVKLINKRNSIIFLKSCKENIPQFYEEIFSKMNVFGEISHLLGMSSMKEMIEKEMEELE